MVNLTKSSKTALDKLHISVYNGVGSGQQDPLKTAFAFAKKDVEGLCVSSFVNFAKCSRAFCI